MEIQRTRAAEDVVIDVSESMNRRLKGLPGTASEPESYTIFRVPDIIRREKPEYFDPAVVSIGPYHRSKPKYRAMEEQKWRFLRDFLFRNGNYRINLETCLQAIAPLEVRARRCYSEPIDLSSNEFVEMMVLDACFIIEFSFKSISTDFKQFSVLKEVGWSHTFVATDLILMENQIPFFIIEELLELVLPGDTEKALDRLCSVITRKPAALLGRRDLPQKSPTKIHHLLHACYNYFVPEVDTEKKLPSILERLYLCLFKVPLVQHFINKLSGQPSLSRTLPSATQLQEAGIKFRAKEGRKNKFFDVTFIKGILEIPCICLRDEIKPLFMNLIVFELCGIADHNKTPLTAFGLFLDMIVTSPKDILILEKSGIIENFMSCEERAAMFFNQISHGFPRLPFNYYGSLFHDVNKYCRSPYHSHQATLKRDYFKNPCTTIAFFAGVVLLLLAMLQTFYTVWPYYRQPKGH